MATTPDTEHDRTDIKLTCPVPSCTESFDRVPALMGHVGHHDSGWSRARLTPTEIKQRATAADSAAARKVATVLAYLSRHGVPTDAVTVYYDHAYRSVQIDTNGYLKHDVYTTLDDATDIEGVHYVGNGHWYCDDEFVEDLPPAPGLGECEASGCDRDGPEVQPVTTPRSTIATLCPYHRKEFWGVSS